jgi:hypothetical protein
MTNVKLAPLEVPQPQLRLRDGRNGDMLKIISEISLVSVVKLSPAVSQRCDCQNSVHYEELTHELATENCPYSM